MASRWQDALHGVTGEGGSEVEKGRIRRAAAVFAPSFNRLQRLASVPRTMHVPRTSERLHICAEEQRQIEVWVDTWTSPCFLATGGKDDRQSEVVLRTRRLLEPGFRWRESYLRALRSSMEVQMKYRSMLSYGSI